MIYVFHGLVFQESLLSGVMLMPDIYVEGMFSISVSHVFPSVNRQCSAAEYACPQLQLINKSGSFTW